MIKRQLMSKSITLVLAPVLCMIVVTRGFARPIERWWRLGYSEILGRHEDVVVVRAPRLMESQAKPSSTSSSRGP